MNNAHLLLRPPPYRDESALGYLARVAFVNGYRSVQDVLGLSCQKVTLFELADRTGIPIISLRRAFPPWPAWIIDRWGTAGSTIRFGSNLRRMRFCPYCFREEAYFRRAFLSLFSVACPIHRVSLRDSCDQCGRVFEWRYAAFGECKCGRRFQDMVSPASTPWACCVARSLAAADARQSGSLEYLDEDIPGRLHGDHLCTLLLAFGPLLDGRATGKTGASAGLCEVRNAIAYVQQAAEILSEWPDRFHAHLDRCLENAAETLSLRQAIGPAYRILYSLRLHDCAFEFLRTELRSYMEGHWRGRIDRRHRRFGSGSHSNDVLAGASLRSAMRMRRENILELTSSCVLPAKLLRSRSGRAFVYCQRCDVVALRTQLDGTMDLRAAAHYLGIGRYRLYDLLEHGVLRGERSAGRWKILREAVVC
ncbi:TniQ family protein [Ralstonia pseudosolanacearum]|uniref:TniQ family protein n=1 Tax=Ralstonia pseudosolanacearum TaxID=1310165 RepID=UPI003CED6A0E